MRSTYIMHSTRPIVYPLGKVAGTCRSWQVFEFLDNHLTRVLQWASVAGDNVERQLEPFLTRCGDSRSEDVLRQGRRSRLDRRSPDGFEACPPRFPMHGMS